MSVKSTHYLVADGAAVAHPVFGETKTNRWIACGKVTAGAVATGDKARVTCRRCLAAIAREGF